jgi:hypothetical protein
MQRHSRERAVSFLLLLRRWEIIYVVHLERTSAVVVVVVRGVEEQQSHKDAMLHLGVDPRCSLKESHRDKTLAFV